MPRSNPDGHAHRPAELAGLNVPVRPEPGPEPASLANILGQLFQLRGYGRRRASAHIQEVWQAAAGPQISPQTRALTLKNGVLQVAVFNSVLLAELNGFHRAEILARLKQQSGAGGIRDLKFRLQAPCE